MRATCYLLFVLSAEEIAGKFKRYFPNVLGILADGAIGGKPRHSCDVEHAHARPIGCRQPQPFDASLRCEIGIEIRCDHVVVGMPQRVHERSESVGLSGCRRSGPVTVVLGASSEQPRSDSLPNQHGSGFWYTQCLTSHPTRSVPRRAAAR